MGLTFPFPAHSRSAADRSEKAYKSRGIVIAESGECRLHAYSVMRVIYNHRRTVGKLVRFKSSLDTNVSHRLDYLFGGKPEL